MLDSPAIDAGTNTALTDDIRGLPRPFNLTDIGAYEWQGLTLSTSRGDNQHTPINTAFADPLTVTVGSAAPPPQAEPVTGARVTFTAPAAGASSALSPTSPVTVTCTGAPAVCTAAVTATANGTAGSYHVTASAAGATSVNLSLTNDKISQTITFNPPATGTVGGNTLLSATGGDSGNPVTFASQTLSVCRVSDSTANYLTPGTCTLRASQAGDANYSAAPDVDRDIAISPATSTTTPTSSANPANFGQSITLTATVVGQHPTGTVAFSADGAPIAGCASVALSGGGNGPTAACTPPALTGGTHAITATYSGDANNATSNGSLQQVVRNVFTGPSATGQGDITASFSGGGTGCNLTQAALVNPPATLPPGYTFPYGLLRFALGDACDGGTVTVRVTYPAALPAGTSYWKYGKTHGQPSVHWYELPATLAGNTLTFTLADGGTGDDDLAVNGRITDDGGPGVPTTSIPTLSAWSLLLLAGLLGLFGMRRARRASGPQP